MEPISMVGINSYNLQKRYQSSTFLLMECGKESPSIHYIKVLLEDKPDLEMTTKEKRTPLCLVCKSGHLDIVQLLIKAGANVNYSGGVATPLYWGRNHVEIVNALLAAGADPNIEDMNKRIPIEYALEHQKYDVAEKLILAGSNMNHPGISETPLQALCKVNQPNLLRLALRCGHDPNKRFGDLTSSTSFQTPLMNAVCAGLLENVKVLLEMGADPEIQDIGELNETALQMAKNLHHDHIVHYFENRKAAKLK